MGKPRILVTGASGFSGSRIAEYLHELSYPTFVHKGRKLSSDLANPTTMWALPEHIDVLVHAAGVSPGEGVSNNDLARNIQIVQNLCGWARGKGNVKQVIFLSSVSLYGTVQDSVLFENSPSINPCFYGRTKSMCEDLFKDAGIPTVSLRLPAVVGKGAARNWPARVVEQHKRGEVPEIYSNYALYNNAVHIEFLCQLVEKLIQEGPPGSFYPMLVASLPDLHIYEALQLLAPGMFPVPGPKLKESFYIRTAKLEEMLTPWPVSQTLRRYMEDL